MKKQLLAVSLAALFMSGGAFATAIVSGGDITSADCTLIGTTIRVNLSNDVNGAYECDQLATTVNLATCHESGSRAPLVVACVNSAAAGAPAVYNDASCPGGDGSAAAGEFTIADFRGYAASSQGGGVAASDLGGACTDATAEALLP